MAPPRKRVSLTCAICDKNFEVIATRAATATTCSRACSVTYRARKLEKKVTLICPVCEAPFSVPACHADRRIYCSDGCREASVAYRRAKSNRTSGAANPSWKGGVVAHSGGYRMQWVGSSHPFAVGGYILQHRKVMEDHLRETDPSSPFLVRLGDQVYLSRDFDVHHRDENKANNALDNLECLAPGAHRALHAEKRKA